MTLAEPLSEINRLALVHLLSLVDRDADNQIALVSLGLIIDIGSSLGESELICYC